MADKQNRVIFLQGSQAYLRPLEVDDSDNYARWMNDPKIRCRTGRSYPLSEAEERQWLERAALGTETGIHLAIVLTDSDRHIGATGLHRLDLVNRNAEFGIIIGDVSCHGRGIGTEVGNLVFEYGFGELGLNSIYSNVLSDNEASLALHRQLGFTKDGQRRDRWFKNGRWVDEVNFSLLRHEFYIKRLKNH